MKDVAAQVKEITEKLYTVAKILGGIPEDGSDGNILRFRIGLDINTGRGIYFYAQFNVDKLEVSGSFPRAGIPYMDQYGKKGTREELYALNFDYTPISLSSSKTAEKIADDIKKRLLPNYNVAFAENYKRALEAVERGNKQVEAMTKLVPLTKGVSLMRLQVDSPNCVTFHGLCVTAEQAEKILRLLQPEDKQ